MLTQVRPEITQIKVKTGKRVSEFYVTGANADQVETALAQAFGTNQAPNGGASLPLAVDVPKRRGRKPNADNQVANGLSEPSL